MSEKRGIVINRMYAGDYLSSNIGHEVINLYQADNGGHYLYLNATGDFAKEHADNIGWMLLAKYHQPREIEVIGMAAGLEDVYIPDNKFSNKYGSINEDILRHQQDYVKKEGGITYGGVSIFDIFGDAGQQSVFITYKAKKLYVPANGCRLFIHFGSDKPTNTFGDVICLNEHEQAKTSLKQYIYSGTRDFDRLMDMINDMRLWRESNDKVDKKELNNQQNISLFDICQIQNDENRFSNAFSYFMTHNSYRDLWIGFFRKRCGVSLNRNFTVAREELSKIDDAKYNKKYPGGGRIDLLIRDANNIIVIENKIRSDINKIESDKDSDQLERYYNYIVWQTNHRRDSADRNKNARFFILSPEYNKPIIDERMRDNYTIITYKDVYEYLEENRVSFEKDSNFVAFFNAMLRHTYSNVADYLHKEMEDKFYSQIRALHDKNS